jgi:hypothetical protein
MARSNDAAPFEIEVMDVGDSISGIRHKGFHSGFCRGMNVFELGSHSYR